MFPNHSYGISLLKYLKKSLKNNKTILSENHELEALKNEVYEEKSRFRPNVDFRALSQSSNKIEDSYEFDQDVALSLRANYPIYNRRNNLFYSISDNDYKIRKITNSINTSSIILNLCQEYLTALKYSRLLSVTSNQILLVKNFIKKSKIKRKLGSLNDVDIYMLQSNLKDLEMSYFDLSNLYSLELIGIKESLGREELGKMAIPKLKKFEDYVSEDTKNYLKHPEVRLLDLQIKKKEMEIDLSRSNLYPTFNSFVNYDSLSDQLNDGTYEIGFEFNLNLYEGSKSFYKTLTKTHEMKSMEFEKESRLKDLKVLFLKEMRKLEYLVEKGKNIKRNMKIKNLILNKKNIQLKNGAISILDLLPFQNNLNSMKRNHISNESEILLTKVNLLFNLGYLDIFHIERIESD